jgi:hypothetical protein
VKAFALIPLIAMPLNVSAVVPVFCSVTVAVVVLLIPATILVNVIAFELRVTPEPIAVLESPTISDPALVLSAIDNVAVSVPPCIGAKIIVTVQFPATASDEPQVVCDTLKRFAFVPVIVVPLKVSGTVPLLVSVTVAVEVVVPDPVVTEAKLNEFALRLTVGTAADPVRVTVTGLLAVLLAIDRVALSDAVAASL